MKVIVVRSPDPIVFGPDKEVRLAPRDFWYRVHLELSGCSCGLMGCEPTVEELRLLP